MQRLLVLVCLAAVLAACGFRPRASLALVKVSSSLEKVVGQFRIA